MTMIEKAARALRILENGGDDYEMLVKHRDQMLAGAVLDSLHSKVRAVLQAIREPSEAMLERAGFTEPLSGPEYDLAWQAMIDAALAEDSGQGAAA